MSPTQRSLAYLRELGYYVAVAEHFNPFAQIRQDLFGICDLVGLRKGETLCVQCTSASNVSARVHKITEHLSTPRLREAGWRIEIQGWTKGKRGGPRVVDLS